MIIDHNHPEYKKRRAKQGFGRYCKDLYKNYKTREKEIKHPDILKFIKDYEDYYKRGEDES